MDLQEAASFQRIDGSDIDQVQRTTTRAVLRQNAVEKLFTARSKKFRLYKRIFLFKPMQKRVAVIDVQRSVPHHPPFFFSAFDETGLSGGLGKNLTAKENFQHERQEQNLVKPPASFFHKTIAPDFLQSVRPGIEHILKAYADCL